MTYKLTFLKSALKEWRKLSPEIARQFKEKLQKRIESPHVSKDKLSTLENCYKIKLRASGYRLVYRVFDEQIVVQVVAIAKRDKNFVYEVAHSRIDK